MIQEIIELIKADLSYLLNNIILVLWGFLIITLAVFVYKLVKEIKEQERS